MLAQSLKGSWWLVLPAVFLTCPTFAQDKPSAAKPPNATKPLDDPGGAVESLQAAHARDGETFVLQGELDFLIPDEGGGACPSAAAIDALQVLRVMAGQDKLANPHKVVLAAFDAKRDLLKGRLSNNQLVDLLKHYRSHLGGFELEVDVESAPNSGYRAHTRTWAEASGPSLDTAARTLKILSYTVTDPAADPQNAVRGRHFVLLKSRTDHEIAVVDPTDPVKERHYVIEYKAGEKGDKARVLLPNPPGRARKGNLVFELNTVFTVTLTGKPSAGDHGPGCVEYVNRRFDETAHKLQGTKAFLDPLAWRKQTAAFGLPGLDLPVKFGGSEWPATKMVEVFKHAGEHNLNFRDVVGGAHVRPLLESKSPEVHNIVRQVAKGEGYMAIAITEPEAGSDIQGIRSRARKVEGGYLLNGAKRFNARLDQATHVIIFTNGTTGERGKLSAFVVPITNPGLKLERLTAHGLTGNSYGGVEFKDLFVPESHLLGADGEGMRLFFKHFLYWRLMQSAAAIGTGENALVQMKDRIRSRHAFGSPIARFTHLQQPIGQYTTELRMAHSLAKDIAARIDRDDYGKETRALICGLKAEGVEMALRAVDSATRAFGGEGYSTRVDLGDRLRDLNGLRIADGTTDVMRMEVVRHTYDEWFWNVAIEPDRLDEKPR